MNGICIGGCFFLSGFFMKFSDDEWDENGRKVSACLFGILCGIFSALPCIYHADSLCMFAAIMLGTLLMLKVDGVHHVIAMATCLIVVALFGTTAMEYKSLFFCTLGAMIDEIGNDNQTIYSLGKIFMWFFDYRFTMKLVILILAIGGEFEFHSFFYFLCFEIAYEAAREVYEAFFLNKK